MAMEKQTAIIIPARYGSSRLEGKPLLKAGGKYIIQWVWEKCRKCDGIDRIIVATDDERIYDVCKEFGAEVEMTSKEHKSGSDRIAEVASRHPEIPSADTCESCCGYASRSEPLLPEWPS